MSQKLTIKFSGTKLQADLIDCPTTQALLDELPINGMANRWGDEVYFTIPVDVPLESDAREVVDAGDLAYWPDGNTFCIFFGPTPLSQGDEIRAASAVNVFGKISGDLSPLKNTITGTMFELQTEK